MISTLLATLAIAFAGNEMGNGTDHFKEKPAWFTGKDNVIRACSEVDRSFGVSENELRESIEIAFTKWLRYANERGVERAVIGSPIFYARTLSWQPTCVNADLRVYAGVDNEETSRQKQKYQDPLAFAYVSESKTRGWSKGFIWLNRNGGITTAFPDWSQKNVLLGVLLHEFGHIFGVTHVSGTIMDLNLSRQIYEGEIAGDALGQIDNRRAVLFTPQADYSGVLGVGTGNDEDYRVFEWLMGRRMEGKIKANLKGHLLLGATLSISDKSGSGAFAFKCNGSWQSPVFEMAPNIFHRQDEYMDHYKSNGGGVEFCELTLRDGKKVPAIIEYNMSNDETLGPINIKRMDSGYPRTVFRAVVNGVKNRTKNRQGDKK